MRKLLVHISQRLANEWRVVGIELDFTDSELRRILLNHPHDLGHAILDMLQTWNSRSKLQFQEKIKKLKSVMEDETVGRVDVSRSIDDKLTGCTCLLSRT